MTRRTKRRFPLLKSLLATGLLGASGGGAYYYAAGAGPDLDAHTSPEAAASRSETLNAVVEAWSAETVADPVVATHEPASAPAPPPDMQPLPPAPEQRTRPTAGRYAQTPLPFDLPPAPAVPGASDTVARGQTPDEEPMRKPADLPAPVSSPPRSRSNALRSEAPASSNPLRSGGPAVASAESEPARAAFSDPPEASGASAAAAAAAAFGQPHSSADAPLADGNVTPAAAEEPLGEPASLPESMPPGGLPGELSAPPEPANPFPGDGSLGPAPAGSTPPSQEAPTGAGDMLPPPREMPAAPEVPNQLRAAPHSQPQPPAPSGNGGVEDERSALTRDPLSAETAPDEPPTYDATPLGQASEGVGRPGEQALEGRQQPTLAIQKFAPAEIQVGKPCKFLVKVRNVGQRQAMDVRVHDQVPEGTRLAATTPQAETAGGEVTWSVGALSPGEERTLEMELVPLEEGQIGSVATVTFSAAASAKAKCTRPQLALRMTAPSKVMVGREQTIQIEIKNPGTGDATNVMVLENVPDNLRHDAGPVLEFPVGTLRAGETRTLQLKMLAESPGRVVNKLTAHADGDLHVEQQVEFEVVAPSLQVAVDGPKRRYLERPATYTVKLRNPGTASAQDVRLVTRLPRGMRFMKANHMGEYDSNTHAVYWSLAELPEGEQNAAVQLTALPVTPGDHKLQVQCEAREGLRADAEHGTQVEGIAAISFTVVDVEDPIEVSGETEYEVRVSNQGSKAATNLTVQATAPAGMRIISAAGDARHRIEGGAVRFESIPQLAPQGDMTFRIRVQGVQPGDHRLTVEVGSDDLAQPVRKEESTRVFGDE